MTSGHVQWPSGSNGYHNSGEGGMWAYVFFTADPDPGKPEDFTDCSTPSGVIALPLQDVVCHDEGSVYDKGYPTPYPGGITDPAGNYYPASAMVAVAAANHFAWACASYEISRMDAGTDLLAAVCLGSTGQSLYNDELGEYFKVTHDTLTITGQKLVLMLSQFYDRTPRFVTYLDT